MRESSEMARKKREESGIPQELLDKLLEDYEKPEDLLGKDGILDQLKKAVMERALGAELTEHLGYDTGRSIRSWKWKLAKWIRKEAGDHRQQPGGDRSTTRQGRDV